MFGLYTSLYLFFEFVNLAYSVEVQTSHGIVRGFSHTTIDGRKYVGFRGIRYAAPPIGPNRFKEPQPLEPWTGVIDAYKDGQECLQFEITINNITGSEDCLFLNVFTPQVPDNENYLKLPVMVWIHGGHWSAGNSYYYPPEALVDHGVVLVTINYRLGALGFISTGDINLSGNFGLKDQVAALRWIRQNIAYFNGDVQRVTIFGQEAGGASVHYHMLSPLSQGLFHGAISQSGTALCPWASPQNQTFHSEKLGTLVGCNFKPTSDFVECLRTKDGKMIVMAQQKISKVGRMVDSSVFKPVVEGEWNGAFLRDDPLELLQDGNIEISIPWIVGITSHEGGHIAEALHNNQTLLHSISVMFDEHVPRALYYEQSFAAEAITKEIKRFYFNDLPVSSSPISALSDMYTDALFLWNVDETVRLHSLINSEPIFYYVFSYRGSRSSCGNTGKASLDFGACHGDEINYIFPSKGAYRNENDNKIVEIMTELWTTFAKFKNPNVYHTLTTEWENVASHEIEYLNISETLSSGYGLFHERTQFWASLPLRIKSSEVERFMDEL